MIEDFKSVKDNIRLIFVSKQWWILSHTYLMQSWNGENTAGGSYTYWLVQILQNKRMSTFQCVQQLSQSYCHFEVHPSIQCRIPYLCRLVVFRIFWAHNGLIWSVIHSCMGVMYFCRSLLTMRIFRSILHHAPREDVIYITLLSFYVVCVGGTLSSFLRFKVLSSNLVCLSDWVWWFNSVCY